MKDSITRTRIFQLVTVLLAVGIFFLGSSKLDLVSTAKADPPSLCFAKSCQVGDQYCVCCVIMYEEQPIECSQCYTVDCD